MTTIYKTFIALLLLAVFSVTYAQQRSQSKTVICDSSRAIFDSLADDYQESVVWQGHSPIQSTTVALFVNDSTRAWTLVEFKDTWACVLAVGDSSSQSRPGTAI
jgi:hypothetical protein